MIARYGIVLPSNPEEANYISTWTWNTFNIFPMKMDWVMGIVETGSNALVGSAMFSNYNGYNVELNYYGAGVLTLGMIRHLAREVLKTSVIRVTVRQQVTNVAATKATKKFGFVEEGIERDFYGPGKDCVRLVLFRDTIERLAGIKKTFH